MINKHVNTIEIGKISTPYGLFGWLKIISFTENKKNILNYRPWIIEIKNKYNILDLQEYKFNNRQLIIKIKEINDRNKASYLTNSIIRTNSSSLPKLNNKVYYWKDIIGCKIFDLDNNEIGIVINMIDIKYNDIMIIKNNIKFLKNIKEYLIPFILDKIIKEINILDKIIVVDWDFKINF